MIAISANCEGTDEVVSPLRGVAQVNFSRSPDCRGRCAGSRCTRTEEWKKTGEGQVEVEREVGEDQGETLIMDGMRTRWDS